MKRYILLGIVPFVLLTGCYATSGYYSAGYWDDCYDCGRYYNGHRHNYGYGLFRITDTITTTI